VTGEARPGRPARRRFQGVVGRERAEELPRIVGTAPVGPPAALPREPADEELRMQPEGDAAPCRCLPLGLQCLLAVLEALLHFGDGIEALDLLAVLVFDVGGDFPALVAQ